MVENLIDYLIRLLYEVPAILIAIGIHEYAHAMTARSLGDETASEMGLANFNPFPKIDLLGFLMFLWFRFGWTKAVPIDFRNLKGPNKRLKSILVLLSGMAGNFLLALFLVLFLQLKKPAPESYLFNLIGYSIIINFNMVIVNALPLLPMDAGRIIALFYPRYERYAFVCAMLLVLFAFTNLSLIIQTVTNSIFKLFT
jgi:Zn-dependent protease